MYDKSLTAQMDTAFRAYKQNPNAAKQIVAAQQRGMQVPPQQGLAAAAALVSPPQPPQQGPQGTVMQKLAAQQGIMSQLPAAMQQGQQQAPQQAPQQMPQGMASGGLVAFADGGDVRRFGTGTKELLQALGISELPKNFPYATSGIGVTEFPEDFFSPENQQALFEADTAEWAKIKEAAAARNAEAEKWQNLRDIAENRAGKTDPEILDRIRAQMREGAGKQLERTTQLSNQEMLDRIKQHLGTTEAPQEAMPAKYGSLYGAEAPSTSDYKSLYPEAPTAVEGYTPYRATQEPMGAPSSMGPPKPRSLGVGQRSAEAAEYLDKLRGLSAAPSVSEAAAAAPAAVDPWTGGEGFKGFNLGRVGKAASAVASELGPLGWAASPEVRGSANLSTAGAKLLAGVSPEKSGAGEALLQAAEYVNDLQHPIERLKRLKGDVSDAVDSIKGYFSEDKGLSALNWDKYAPDWMREMQAEEGVHEETPKAAPHKEATKVDKEFSRAQQSTPSTVHSEASTPRAIPASFSNAKGMSSLAPGESYGVPETSGAGIGGLEQYRDMVRELRGSQKMSPEIAERLKNMEESGRTSTIMQTLLGTIGSGLSSYGRGPHAWGDAAIGGLSAYQRASAQEEAANKDIFNVIKAYENAPAEEQRQAADFVLKSLEDKAKLASEERRAGAKGLSFEERVALRNMSDTAAKERAALYSGNKDMATQLAYAQAIQKAAEKYSYLGEEEALRRGKEEVDRSMAAAGGAGGLGGGGLGGGGLGGGSLGNSIVMTRAGGLQLPK